jgi:AcrR family transcriptional regulator
MRQRKHIPPALLALLRYEYEETNTPVDDLAARAGMSNSTFYTRVSEYGWSLRCPALGGAGQTTRPSAFGGARAAAASAVRKKFPPTPGRGKSRRADANRVKSVAAASGSAPPNPVPSRPVPSGAAQANPADFDAERGRADTSGEAQPDRQTLAARIQHSIERELDAIEKVLDLLQPQNGNEAERAARTLAALARTLREVANLDTDPSAEPDDDDDAGPRDMDEFRRDLARRMEAIVAAREGATDREPDA